MSTKKLLRHVKLRAHLRASQKQLRHGGYILPAVLVLALILVVSSTALMVRATGERTASGQDRQILLARNNAENGISEIIRQLNGPYSYLVGLDRDEWEETAKVFNQRRADYYESIKSQLENLKKGIQDNPRIRVGCGKDSDGNLQLYGEDDINSLLQQLTTAVTNSREGRLPAWITGQIDSEREIKRDSLNISNLLDYRTNRDKANNIPPTQATLAVVGRIGTRGNTQAVIQQSFNLQEFSENSSPSGFLYGAGLLFKSAKSNLGGLDIETAGEIIKDPTNGQDATAYDFCLANATCIDCESIDAIQSKGDRAAIAGIVTALKGEYDFPYGIITKSFNNKNVIFEIIDVQSESIKIKTLNQDKEPNLNFFTVNFLGNQKDNANLIANNDLINKQLESLFNRDRLDANNSLNGNQAIEITVDGRNRAVIQIEAGSSGVIPQFVIRRSTPNTPLPIVVIEESGTLTINGNESLGDAFIIAPNVDLIINGGGGEASRLITGSLWINSIQNPSNAGGKSSKTFLDGEAEIVVDPEMRTLLAQFGLAQLGVNQSKLNRLDSYRLVPGSASSWTLNSPLR
nr:hypothetical protein [Synechococcus elongatus]